MYKVKAKSNFHIYVKDLDLFITDEVETSIPKVLYEKSINIKKLVDSAMVTSKYVLDDGEINNNINAIVAPAVTDDIDKKYAIGSQWIDTVAKKAYICLDNKKGAAVWKEITNAS
jgi:hypothetical protein